ncbi:MAG: hypothetical protein K0V04_12730 [Deltaproteobacteria bacterium]|nr:hypothetical protein [Deltaproteobacteria bacterium]
MRLLLIIVAGFTLALLPLGTAWAYSGGVSGGGCGCHGSGEVAIDVSTNPAMIGLGETVTVMITISSGTAAEAGLFLESDGDEGEFDPIAGQGLAEVNNGVTHTQPQQINGGQAQFAIDWTAPNEPGAVRFDVWAVAANGNNNSGGDDADNAAFDFVFGCAPQTYYRDFDGDGFGRTNQPRTFCAGQGPSGYADQPDDCDDNRAETYPGATEFCNQIDDDCDDEIDEQALPVALYPDADGDGYYGLAEFSSGEMMMGCVPTVGWAAESGDCRPEDPAINPSVEEVCNGFDDDCDSDVDERVRPQCGVGWCRRESLNCEPEFCMPGPPREEECNFFDDDCDGLLDEDTPCPDGESCQAGECRPMEPGGVDTSGGPGGTSGTGTTGGAGQDDAGGGCGCRSGGGPGGAALPWLLLVAFSARRRGRR